MLLADASNLTSFLLLEWLIAGAAASSTIAFGPWRASRSTGIGPCCPGALGFVRTNVHRVMTRIEMEAPIESPAELCAQLVAVDQWHRNPVITERWLTPEQQWLDEVAIDADL